MYIWQRKDWPRWRWRSEALAAVLEQITRERSRLAGTALALSGDASAQLLVELMTREAVATSAIEGVRVDAEGIRSSLMKRLGLGALISRAPPQTRATKGLIAVLADSTENRGPLTAQRLQGWQAALFPGGMSESLRPVLAGEFRAGAEPMQVVSGVAGRQKVHYEAPPADRLEADLDVLLEWFNHGPPDLHPALRAGIAHLWFETIHPFEDGNGRVGRAVLDLALAQEAKSPERVSRLWSVSRQIEAQRKAYYEQLEAAQKSDLDITGWLAWCAQQILAAHQDALGSALRVVRIAAFWAMHRDKALNTRQHKALERVLRDAVAGEEYLTRKRYIKITDSVEVTASRDLAQLLEWKMIRQDASAGGRSTRYTIALPEAPAAAPQLAGDAPWG